MNANQFSKSLLDSAVASVRKVADRASDPDVAGCASVSHASRPVFVTFDSAKLLEVAKSRLSVASSRDEVEAAVTILLMYLAETRPS